MTRPITRRQAMLASAAAASFAPAARAAPSSLPAKPSLIVAGPAGGRADRWADVIAAPLGQRLVGNGPLGWENVGGADGVTGVNQFQARANPDGTAALLLPGAALLAWLVGDPRVRFDAGTWAPLWGGTTAAIVATRAPLTPGRELRVAVQSVAGAGLEALLALELMGVDPVPILGPPAEMFRPDVDAVYLRGAAAREPLAAYGLRPAFALAGPARHPAFPDLPQAAELFAPALAANPVEVATFRAALAAASLEIALVMPAMTPATVLAWWRRGCDQLDDAGAVRDAAAASLMRQDDSAQVAAQLASVAIDMPAMLSLRTRLAGRYHWRPS